MNPRLLLAVCFAGALWAQAPVKPEPGKNCIPDAEAEPPKLRRGKPGERAAEKPSLPICETLAIPIGAGREEAPGTGGPGGEARTQRRIEDAFDKLPLIEKMKRKSMDYNDKLPNFICQQLIRRNYAETKRSDWRLQDTIMVSVTYVDGRESYKDATRNMKKVDWKSLKDSGTFSEGEFGTMMFDVLHPSTNAAFTLRGRDTIGGTSTEVYNFVVEQPNSHWTLSFDKQSIKPKYKGAIWIDPKELMVRRIEMESVSLPPSYPVSAVEQVLEYGPVRIGDKTFTVPTTSQNLACFRFQPGCVMNEMEFRNYKKFSAEVTISASESTVSFDSDPKPASPPDKPPSKKQ